MIQHYDRKGEQIRESSETNDPTEARDLLKKKLAEVTLGIHKNTGRITYDDLRDNYLRKLEVAAQTGRAKSLRHSADGPYLEAVRRLDDFFDGFQADKIGPKVIREYQKVELAKGRASGTINRSVSALRRMFTLALEDEDIERVPHFPMLAESKPREGTLSPASYSALLRELPDHIRPIVTMGFRTGMRLGEILKLRWDDIDGLERVLRVRDSKNNDARVIPFAEAGDLESALKDRFSRRQPDFPFVCYRINRRGHVVRVRNFRKVWRRASVKCGLGKWEAKLDSQGSPLLDKPRYTRSQPRPKMRYSGLIFHDLRRSFVTDAENAGAPRHEIMKMSGHRTESVYKRYAIGSLDPRRAALTKVERYRQSQAQVKVQLRHSQNP